MAAGGGVVTHNLTDLMCLWLDLSDTGLQQLPAYRVGLIRSLSTSKGGVTHHSPAVRIRASRVWHMSDPKERENPSCWPQW